MIYPCGYFKLSRSQAQKALHKAKFSGRDIDVLLYLLCLWQVGRIDSFGTQYSRYILLLRIQKKNPVQTVTCWLWKAENDRTGARGTLQQTNLRSTTFSSDGADMAVSVAGSSPARNGSQKCEPSLINENCRSIYCEEPNRFALRW